MHRREDIDAPRRRLHTACATADGITRIATPYLDHARASPGVGSRGFVARGRDAEPGLALHHKHETAELTVAAERDRAVETGHEHPRTREQDRAWPLAPDTLMFPRLGGLGLLDDH